MKTPLGTLEHNKTYSTRNAVASTISQNLINAYIPLFALSVIGVTNQQMGLISSLPSLITLFAVWFGTRILNKSSSHKLCTVIFVLLNRIGIASLFVVPYLPHHQGLILIVIVAAANLPGAAAGLAWQSMIAEMIPEKERNAYFSRRNRTLTVAAMFTALVSGYVLQMFDKHDPNPYVWMFILGLSFGLLEAYYLWKHQEPKPGKVPVAERKQRKTKERAYLVFLFCAAVFQFGWQMAWSSMTIYQIQDAHATALWISLFTVFNQIAQIASYGWWGRVSDRIGNSKALFWVGLGMATAPVLMLVSTNLYYLTGMNLFTGLFVSGTVTLLFNRLLEVSPKHVRTEYIAHYTSVMAIVGFLAPQAGVYILDSAGMAESMWTATALRATGGILFLWSVYHLKKKGVR